MKTQRLDPALFVCRPRRAGAEALQAHGGLPIAGRPPGPGAGASARDGMPALLRALPGWLTHWALAAGPRELDDDDRALATWLGTHPDERVRLAGLRWTESRVGADAQAWQAAWGRALRTVLEHGVATELARADGPLWTCTASALAWSAADGTLDQPLGERTPMPGWTHRARAWTLAQALGPALVRGVLGQGAGARLAWAGLLARHGRELTGAGMLRLLAVDARCLVPLGANPTLSPRLRRVWWAQVLAVAGSPRAPAEPPTAQEAVDAALASGWRPDRWCALLARATLQTTSSLGPLTVILRVPDLIAQGHGAHLVTLLSPEARRQWFRVARGTPAVWWRGWRAVEQAPGIDTGERAHLVRHTLPSALDARQRATLMTARERVVRLAVLHALAQHAPPDPEPGVDTACVEAAPPPPGDRLGASR